ncbi:MAG: hypothetical protein ACKO1M_16665, partial [Planctomycetota bacterium]
MSPQVVASLVIRTGDRRAAVEKAAMWCAESMPLSIEPVTVGGFAWQRALSPLGPASWGINDGSFVVARGEGSLESVVARMSDAGPEEPAWKKALRQRAAFDRPSTLAYFNAAEALRIMTSLPAPDRDKLLTFLDASGLGKLEAVGALTGMTAEGVGSSLWLGCEGPPRGIFAAPATGIGPRQLTRIPADAMMAQAWSLDLSAMLATVLGIAEATDPESASAWRANLQQFRAVAGFDLDAHLLEPL